MVQVHLGPQAIEARATKLASLLSRLSLLNRAPKGARDHQRGAREALMKKLLLLAAAIGAAVFAAKKKNQQAKPADPWAQASDKV